MLPAQKIWRIQMLIELVNICKSYGVETNRITVLRNISIGVDFKEFIAIMGKSGCGKTTLINILATIIKPDSGDYFFDEEDISAYKENELAVLKRRNISVVFQDFNLIEDLDIKNNIILPFIFDKSQYDKEYLEKILKDLDIDKIMDKYPEEISGGEKQRVAIARALLIKPKVILADEPTGNLDSENSAIVIKMLRKCVDEYGSTVVMVTHDYDMAKNADRIYEMSDGKIIR